MSHDVVIKPIEFIMGKGNTVKCTFHRKRWSSGKCKKCNFYLPEHSDKKTVGCGFPDPEDMERNIK
jgi:hypothetical protein